MLRYRVHRAFEAWSYTSVGKLTAVRLAEALSTNRFTLDSADVLDFGCGPGRVANEVKALVPRCRVYATDIDAEAIAWAQAHLSGVARFEINHANPPTRYASGFFDGVYSISLFTHLDEQAQLAWLQELQRVVKQGGWFLATVHGRPAQTTCTAQELSELAVKGIAFRVGRTGMFKLDGLPDAYQTTFHTKSYIYRVWTRYFDLVDYLEGGLSDHHDFVVMRRRTES